ncbi:MAG: class I adenylate cyclase [Desulfobacteraceae bacterium]|nr:class I adenylate cyclase [Desulfobacteraceae bacterium]
MLAKEKIDRYLAYNRSRIRKAVLFNEERAALILKIVPLLLHVNQPDLPGFVSDPACPAGIVRFDPRQVISPRTLARFFPKSSILNHPKALPPPERCLIQSLMTIGSVGSVAQTEKSDCDYWLGLNDHDFPGNQLDLLREKCRKIEEWALERGAEIHLFPMDIGQTKANSFESQADDESAGSALKMLLKDELFRTHILVAGKMPLWWLIPPGLTDSGYHDFVRNLAAREQLNLESFIDLGYISDMPKAEIFGACLWQMNKALDSPFKSVLKFAYLELLMNDRQGLNLFSDRIKQLVTFPECLSPEQRLAIDDIDPYLLLAKELVAFYQRQQPGEGRDEFIRACLLMKTLEDLKPSQEESEDAVHIQAAAELIGRWGLLPADADHYLNFRAWSHQDRVAAGGLVHRYLGDTYKRLSGWRTAVTGDGQLAITEQDIAILGRKLSSFYAKKPNKIEFIQSLSRQMMSQSDLILHGDRQEGRDLFFAYQGEEEETIKNDPRRLIIRHDDHLIRLIVWLMINGILTPKTRLHPVRAGLDIDLGAINGLIRAISAALPRQRLSHIPASQLLEKEAIISALAVVNFDKGPVRGAKAIRSSIVSANNYGEYFLHDYETLPQYKNALRLLLTRHGVSRWTNTLSVFIPPQPEQHALQALLDG